MVEVTPELQAPLCPLCKGSGAAGPTGPEIEALRATVEALKPFDKPTCERILRYLCDRYDLQLTNGC